MSILMREYPLPLADLNRVILLDIMHNRGTTNKQIKHRINQSSHLINSLIENLVSQKLVDDLGKTGKMIITQRGIDVLLKNE